MKKYVCETCGWIYDEKEGDPEGGIEPGTKFEDIEFTLHYNDKVMQRHLVISKKAKNTPDSFPRIYSRIAKKPL